MTPSESDPNNFAVIFSLHRELCKTVFETAGISLTDFRVLNYVMVCEDNDLDMGKSASKNLQIARSSLSTSLKTLREKRYVNGNRSNGSLTHCTLAGKTAFESAQLALKHCIEHCAPALQSSERGLLDMSMIIIADRLGIPIALKGELDLVFVYVEVNSRVIRMLRLCASRNQLSLNELLVLCSIAEHPDGINPSELSKRLKLPKPSITNIGWSLAQKGFVSEKRDEIDARMKVVSATTTGMDALSNAIDAFWSSFYEKVRVLSEYEFSFFRAVNARC